MLPVSDPFWFIRGRQEMKPCKATGLPGDQVTETDLALRSARVPHTVQDEPVTLSKDTKTVSSSKT